ncbi:GH92 family glycosyl hydrolase [Arenibacter sp. F20364]|uniref:GH92 family glycosyl hydrolase n=1 Tax=Arenibacter sp. F20364 TaxID=2926415 RepID=UPI001FF5C1D7|nr:GH92 family glycosyl hydrolase [Arenibacter sp. F20364]MCK0189773.1 GH92 family glycosyl hydrolase [Arenibacter sp. F20364]
MKLLQRIAKITAYAIGMVIGLVLLAIFTASYKYNNIVKATPKNQTENLSPGELGKYVNTFIGTGGFPYWVCGFNFPGATVPFGMVRLSPETMSFYNNTKDFSTSGYYYGDNKILGFSHTRLAGTGATDGGHFLFTPTTTPTDKIDFNLDYAHKFSHANETAFPGYYRVQLKKEQIISELTATERTGLHRYTFPKDGHKNILIHITNTTGNHKAQDGVIKILPKKNELEGSVKTFGSFAGRFGGIKVYFVAKFDHPFSDYGIWDGHKFSANTISKESDSLKVFLGFSKENITVKVGISHISIENARLNLETEDGDLNFGDILQIAKDKWESKLKLIEIEGGSAEERNVFYSALYRSFQMPTTFNDVNGEYMGFDKKVHLATDFTYYTDLSLWDTFRTVHPLFNLIAKDEQRDMLVSLVEMAKQGGSLPRWPSGYGYSNSMLGSPADMVIAESYLKGIRNFDVELAYKKMRQVALEPIPKDSSAAGREEINGYLTYGYCPTEFGDEAVSKTLEYAWADHSISLLANELQLPDDQKLFQKHSKFYKNVWNPDTQYFQPRHKDGRFVEKFKPLQLTYTDWDDEFTKDYTEGSALQWRWAVPFDADGLVSLFKNKDYFVSQLNNFFAKADPKKATWSPGSYYWHGNEPDIHAAYLFNAVQRPDLTQKWVRWILDNKYDNSYVGIDGNDDAGTLSAWYIFSSLGFYPIAGTDIYQLGAPLFKSATLNIGEDQLVIKTENYAPEHIYVKKILLNNRSLNRTWIQHKEIANGGEIIFIMAKEPQEKINEQSSKLSL